MKHSLALYANAFVELAGEKRMDRTLVRNFLSCIRAKGDMPKLTDILRQIEKLLFTKEGITKVEVRAARDISKEFERGLRAEFGAYADIHVSVTPEIIGGAVIRVDDEILIDASVKRQLDILFSK